MGRRAKVIAFLGTTGTGKSTKAKELAKNLPKVLVLSFAGSGNTWEGIKKIHPTKKALNYKNGWRKIHVVEQNEKELFLNIFNHFKTVCIIFDDCTMYLSTNWQHNKGLKQLIIDHRHNGYDMFFLAHLPSHIPKQIWAFVRYIYGFKILGSVNPNNIGAGKGEKIAAFLKR